MREGKRRDEAIIDAGMKRAAPDRHDHHRDGGWHDAISAGVRRRRRIPLADGARRDRGLLFSTVLSLVFVPSDVHADGRHRQLVLAFGRKLLVTTGEKGGMRRADHKPDRKEPTKIVHSPAAE